MKPQAVTEKRKDKIPYEYYKNKLKECDPAIVSQNTGVFYDDEAGAFTVPLLDTIFTVTYPDGEVSNENPKIKYALKTLILRYLINGQGVDSTGEYKHYRDVKDGNIYFANFNGRCQLRLSKTFKNKENLFIEAAEKLKGRHISFGDHGFTFSFLPKIDVYVVLWSGDEEFPPEAQILFSDNVEYYFTAEDLAFVGDTINDRLAEKAFS